MALPQVQVQQNAQTADVQSKDAASVPKKIDDVKARQFRKKIKAALKERNSLKGDNENTNTKGLEKKILLTQPMVKKGEKRDLKLVITEGRSKFPEVKLNERPKKKVPGIEEKQKDDFEKLNEEDFNTDNVSVIESVVRQDEQTVEIELKNPELLEMQAGESGRLQDAVPEKGEGNSETGLKVDPLAGDKKGKTAKDVKKTGRGEKGDVFVIDRRRGGNRNTDIRQQMAGRRAEQAEAQGDHNDSFHFESASGDSSVETGDAFSGEDNLNVVLKGDGSAITAEGDGGKVQAPISREIQSQLAKQLKEGVNREVVKQTGIILKDNNEGEIRLILKPEALGKVKIRLHLQDNNIVGRIIVENNSVKEIFEQNLSDLTRSLAESGFKTAGLEVSVSGEDRGKGWEQDENQENGSKKRHLAVLAESVPTTKSSIYGDSQINLMI